MRQILSIFLLGILLFLADGVDSHKAHHHHKKHKTKRSSPSPATSSEKHSISSAFKRSPPPVISRKKRKSPPPPKKLSPPPSPRINSPPPPRRRPPPPKAPRSPPPSPSPSPPPPPVDTSFYSYQIVEQFPHNTSSFTEGLQYEEICDPSGTNCMEVFWESTGLYGRSSVRKVQLSTGRALRMRELPDTDFGEGLTKLGNTLHQLTWLSGKSFTYAADNFDDSQTTKTPLSDGWGATNDGTNLIIGDSTDQLYFINPSTMKTVRTITVKDGNRTVKWLNELEYIDGLIYANVFTTQCIVQVDANTGNVVGWIYLNGLRQRMIDTELTQPDDPTPDVLNGIAWDGKRKKLYVTGKLWPSMFHVKPVKMLYADDEIKEMIRNECIIDPNRPL